jgi:hypothetical protein
MHHHADYVAARTAGRRLRFFGSWILALVATALLTAGCHDSGGNSPGVAGAGSSNSASSTTGASQPSALAFSRCMRAHGISDFPDPQSDGSLIVTAGPGSDMDQNNPRFQAANEACKPLLPQGPAPAGVKAANLKYSHCMRAHGISDFPDPDADGHLNVGGKAGSDLDPNSPAYQRADDVCKKFHSAGQGSLETGGAGS